MNTSQKIQRIIAAALLAASAGLALSSCVGQRQITEPDSDRMSNSYRDLAERRAGIGGPVVVDSYRDLAERRAGIGGPVVVDSYRDLAERRAGIGGPVVGDSYRDLSERRLLVTGH